MIENTCFAILWLLIVVLGAPRLIVQILTALRNLVAYINVKPRMRILKKTEVGFLFFLIGKLYLVVTKKRLDDIVNSNSLILGYGDRWKANLHPVSPFLWKTPEVTFRIGLPLTLAIVGPRWRTFETKWFSITITSVISLGFTKLAYEDAESRGIIDLPFILIDIHK